MSAATAMGSGSAPATGVELLLGANAGAAAGTGEGAEASAGSAGEGGASSIFGQLLAQSSPSTGGASSTPTATLQASMQAAALLQKLQADATTAGAGDAAADAPVSPKLLQWLLAAFRGNATAAADAGASAAGTTNASATPAKPAKAAPTDEATTPLLAWLFPATPQAVAQAATEAGAAAAAGTDLAAALGRPGERGNRPILADLLQSRGAGDPSIALPAMVTGDAQTTSSTAATDLIAQALLQTAVAAAPAAPVPDTSPKPVAATADANAAQAVVQAASTLVTHAGAVARAPEHVIGVPVGHPRWADALAHEVRWFVGNDVQNATLRLTPEHLGPVEIRISVTDSQVNLNFGAANADTRDALDQSLPRLREMLSGAGLTLGQVNVQAETRRESQNPALPGRPALQVEEQEVRVASISPLGMVDEYA